MAIPDVIVVFIVFIVFGVLIISKLRTKNPKRYEAIIEWVKDTKKIKESFKRNEQPIQVNTLTDSSRIL